VHKKIESIEEALGNLNQARIVAQLAESYPHQLADNEVYDVFQLLKDLAAPVCGWLEEEALRRE
jgi:hypothetical protein